MTGGSLGQRTPSYGSLQQHIQNGGSGMVPIQISSLVVRKSPSKMLLAGSREKERLLHWIFKLAGRKSFGMLFLVVFCLVICLSLVTSTCKVWYLARITQAYYINRPHVSLIFVSEDIPLDSVDATNLPRKMLNDTMSSDNPEISHISGDQNKNNIVIIPNITGTIVSPTTKPLLLPPATIPSRHPCHTFVFPPPPADRKRTGPRPCPVCYLPVEQAILAMPSSPSTPPVLTNLTYIHDEYSVRTEPFGGSDFGGYPSLKERNDSYDITESMDVHCGFVRGSKPGRQTGFDIDDTDLLEMEQCRGIVVASAIFGNYDVIQQPMNISEDAKQNVCFYMFVDEETELYMKNSSILHDRRKVGLWRIVVVQNLPYTDARRNGKVPKLLLHRIFSNARFSLWIDGKLQLVRDPYQILERFLWRNGATFAISQHYKRFDVFDEAEANKAAGKYENASIDFQVEFYKREGLNPYSEAKLPITSDVPEGCVIIKEHIPITNLFSCLWFNEVDRFTSRDQISFSTVRDKIRSKVNWSVNMFLDCERRNFVVQTYHRDVLEHMPPPPPPVATAIHPSPDATAIHPPPIQIEEPLQRFPLDTVRRVPRTSGRKPPPKRGRDKRGSRRHRKTSAGVREASSISNIF